MASEDVYWNHGAKPIFIVAEYETCDRGGHAIPTSQICIAPGQGIDLSILGLSKEKPAKS